MNNMKFNQIIARPKARHNRQPNHLPAERRGRSRATAGQQTSKMALRTGGKTASLVGVRLWWNWQTRYFEVVVGQPVQVQVLLSAPIFLPKPGFNRSPNFHQSTQTNHLNFAI